MIEIRERDNDDGSGPSLPFIVPASRLSLIEVLHFASKLGETVDVMDGDRYLVSYCGASPYWWPPGEHGGGMHQIGSHGWCHECHKADRGYVHHMDYAIELAVLECEARDDRVLREMCEADGLTPAQYAAEVAGRAVPHRGDGSFVRDVQTIGTDMVAMTADFAVEMWDMTTWRVTVPLGENAPAAASRLAEQRAYAREPRQCTHCHGTRGHSSTCSVTKDYADAAKYPEIYAEFPVHDPLKADD
jgi:hypothetical protein